MNRLHPAKLALALVLSLTAASCANMGRITQVMIPEPLSKEELSGMSYATTPLYGFKLAVSESVDYEGGDIASDVDTQFTEFSECFGIKDRGAAVSQYLITVVDSTFLCPYHGGRCNGEYDPENSLIIVTYRAFNRAGILPLLKHEWAHAYGILSSGHENLDEVKKCTRY